MNKKACYLAGSIEDARDSGTKWRDTITPKLVELGLEVYDPCKSEANLAAGNIQDSKAMADGFIASGQWEKFNEHLEEIIRTDIRMVKRSDFIICYLDNKHHHGGTYCELWEASEHLKIPIYVVSYDAKKDFNKWMLRVITRNGKIFESWAQLMDFLSKEYGKKK